MRLLSYLNGRPRWQRWSIKVIAFFGVNLFVLFPRVDRLPRSFMRYLNPNALIQPQARALDPLVQEFDQLKQTDWDPKKLMAELEEFVYRKIPYAWDWDLWGNADYFPTLEETLDAGREDCDGRALVAASMLRRYGFRSRLATDFAHVWVVTDQGETMNPGKKKAIEFKEDGPVLDWSALASLPGKFSYGLSVFPLTREFILVGVFWFLMLGPGLHPKPAVVWLAILLVGLMILREGGRDWRDPDLVKTWLGLGLWLTTALGMVVQARRARVPQI